MQDSITHEALEALRKVEATVEQGGWRALLVMHGEQVVATYSNLYETHAPSSENHREADAFIAGWNAALRTGQLILAVPSGDATAAAFEVGQQAYERVGVTPAMREVMDLCKSNRAATSQPSEAKIETAYEAMVEQLPKTFAYLASREQPSGDEVVAQLLGRARFLRDQGRIKSPDLMEEAAARIQALETALAEAEGQLAALKDPQAVHIAMLRGSIAKPGPECAWHLYQRDLLDAMPADYRAEAEGRVIADVVAWAKSCYLAHYHHGNRTLRRRLFWIWTAIRWPENIPAGLIKGIATALETGEWKK